jgi:hypothetical protein
MPPYWLEIIAIVSIVATLASVVLIALDVANANPQRLGIMNVIWPLTPLYMGPLGLLAYRAAESSADTPSPRNAQLAYAGGKPLAIRRARGEPFWRVVFVAAARCGTACALGAVLGEWIFFRTAANAAAEAPWAGDLVDLLLAGLLGIVFQYWAMASRREFGFGDGVAAAAREDGIVLLGCLLGLFGWMAICRLLLFPQLTAAHWTYWLMLQVGLLLGFVMSYPVSWWLMRRGVKEAI